MPKDLKENVMKLGQVIFIYHREFVFVKKNLYTYTFINATTGEYDVIKHSVYDSLIEKNESNKSFRDLVRKPKWVMAKIYSDLGIDYSIELK